MEVSILNSNQDLVTVRFDCGPNDGFIIEAESNGGATIDIPMIADEAIDIVETLETWLKGNHVKH